MRESVKICIRANCLKNNNISVTQPTLRRLCQCDYNKYVVSDRGVDTGCGWDILTFCTNFTEKVKLLVGP